MHESTLDRVVGRVAADWRVYCTEHAPADADEATVDIAMRAGRHCAECGVDLVGDYLAERWRLHEDATDAAADLASSPHLIGAARHQAEDAAKDLAEATRPRALYAYADRYTLDRATWPPSGPP